MQQYLNLVKHVLDNGTERGDRTGTGTKSVFGGQMRFNLNEGFPIVTTKFTSFRLVVSELIWFLSGNTNIQYLLDNDNHIWDEWADENGNLGPIYGKQWRSWITPSGDGIDQIYQVINSIKTNPYSRRHIVSAWNPADLPDENVSPQTNVKRNKQALAPCHTLFQFYVSDGKLSCQLYARSQDYLLGTPFNIASYSLLTHMIAKECGLGVGDYVHTMGDIHIYSNHIDKLGNYLTRDPKPLPQLWLNPDVKSVFDYTVDDIKLINYKYHPSIKFPIAI